MLLYYVDAAVVEPWLEQKPWFLCPITSEQLHLLNSVPQDWAIPRALPYRAKQEQSTLHPKAWDPAVISLPWSYSITQLCLFYLTDSWIWKSNSADVGPGDTALAKQHGHDWWGHVMEPVLQLVRTPFLGRVEHLLQLSVLQPGIQSTPSPQGTQRMWCCPGIAALEGFWYTSSAGPP